MSPARSLIYHSFKRPKIKIEGKMLGIIARIDKLNDLKINKNIIKIIKNTAPLSPSH
jgi:hypothetical protein